MRKNENFKRLVIILTAAVMILSVASVVNAEFFDFESDDGGWVATASWDPIGDWEYTDSYDVSNYLGDNTPPPTAYSGDGLWGTIIYDDYTNSGGETYLSQTFDFSSVAPADAKLSFYSWEDAFGSWDYCYINVNGNEEYYSEDYSPTAWKYVEVDLASYAGLSSVEIVFGMHASSVVNYAGWYIDDVQVGPGGPSGSGNDCSDPIVVEVPGDLQFDDLGQTTCGKLDDYSDTGLSFYDGGEDIIYELDVTADTNIIVDISADTSWVGAGLFDDCPDVGTMVASDTYGPDLNFNYNALASESPYYLMIDTWPTPDCTEFDLTINYPQNDMGTTAIIHPTDGDGLDPIYPEAEVENFGAYDEVDVPVLMTVTYLAGGGTLLDEGFEGSFPPAGWTIQTYDGTTYEWEQWAYSDTTYTYEPPGSGDYYAVAQDDETPSGTDVNTGLFTPSMDLSGLTSVDLDFDQCFQDFANYGESEVRTYSGGSLEEVLLFQTTDGPFAGEHTTLTFDPSTYANPSDVQIEFWYTDDYYDSGAWGYAIDDVEVYAAPSIVTAYDQTVLVDVDAGEIKTVDTFPVWNPSSSGLYDVEVCTELVGDADTSNDCLEEQNIVIGLIDVGTNSIDFPQALMGPVPFEPKATVENFGDTDVESVPVHCWIEGAEELKYEENFEDPGGFSFVNKEIGAVSDINKHIGEGSVKLIGETDEIMDFSSWTVLDIDGDGTTWHQTDYYSCEGTYSAYSGIESVGYNSNSHDWLISPPIDVGGGGRIEVEVDYDIEYYWDAFWVGNSPDGVSAYIYYHGDDSGGCTTLDIPLNPSYIAPDGTTRVVFILESDSTINYEGAYVDNVKVYGGGSAIYDKTINTDLAYGEVKQVTFPEFTPPDAADYIINICTEFLPDENLANDCQDLAFSTDAPVYNEETGFGYSSIQEAIDDASPGDTIIVRDGDYYEDIVIDKDITVTGENPPTSTTVLYGTVTITGDGATFMNFKVQPLTVYTDNKAAIRIGANDVTVKDNIVTGMRGLVDPNDPTSTYFTIKGIHIYGGATQYSGVIIDNNIVKDIVNENLTYTTGGGGGTTIFEEHFDSDLGGFSTDNFDWNSGSNAGGDAAGQARLYWLNSDDNDYLASPVFDGSTATTLEFNDYKDCFGTTYDCYFFVEIYDGSTWQDVTPWTNPITGNVGPNSWSIDISSYQNSNMQVQFKFGYDGYNLMYWYLDDVVVLGTSGGGTGPGAFYGGANGIMIQGNLDGIEVTNNEVYDIHSAGWCYGIEFTETSIGPSPTNVLVENNYITNIGVGNVYDVWADPAMAPYPGIMFTVEQGATATDVTLKYNMFDNECYGNAYGLINKDTSNILDATYNWWGKPDGPDSDHINGDVYDAIIPPPNPFLAKGFGSEIFNAGPVAFHPWIGIYAEASASIITADTGEVIIFDGDESFYADASGMYEPDEYFWDFDDGYYSKEKQIGHAYDAPGTYHVSLRTMDNGIYGMWNGKMYDWAYLTIHISSPDAPLTANADGGDLGEYETKVDTELTFYGIATGGMQPYSYQWSFGDGTSTSYKQNPTHAYKEPGTYQATLTVYDNEGDYATDTVDVVVHDTETLIVQIDGPSNGMIDTQLIFESEVTGGTQPYTYDWDFGDGTVSNEENPVHTYESPGTYTVTLTVTDENELTDTTTNIVNIDVEDEIDPPEIKEVKGGFGIRATIAAGSEECCWHILVEGNYVFYGGEANDTIDAETEEVARLGLSLALGKVNVTVEAGEMEKDYTAFALGPFYLNIKEVE